jgi:hypothetical protein
MVKISPSYECLLYFLFKKKTTSLALISQHIYKLSLNGSGSAASKLTNNVPTTHPATSPILALQYTHCPTVTRLHHLPPLSPLIPVNHSSHPVHLTTILAATYQAAK